MARTEHHSWGQRNAGRRRRVRPTVRAAARRAFVLATVAIVAVVCCGFVAKGLFESRVLMTPYVAR
jgi:hypothetical protein